MQSLHSSDGGPVSSLVVLLLQPDFVLLDGQASTMVHLTAPWQPQRVVCVLHIVTSSWGVDGVVVLWMEIYVDESLVLRDVAGKWMDAPRSG